MSHQSTRDIPPKKSFSIIQRVIATAFLLTFVTIIITVICFSWIPQCGNPKELLFPNIISLLISLLAGIACYYIFRKIPISQKVSRVIIATTFILLFLLQIFILYHIYFKTGWDAHAVDLLSDQVVSEGFNTTAGSSSYLSMYSNNVLIVTILSLIKSLPIIGGKYFTVVAINALLVNLAGLITCLTIKKLVSRKVSIMSIFIIAPLLLFSPWTIVPYSDTFAILVPILTFYIYIGTQKWWKYAPIVFFSLLGYYIKPTIVFVLIAIILVELLKHRWYTPRINKNFWLRTLSIIGSVLLVFLTKNLSFARVNYQPDPSVPQANIIHYLSMGQNSENCGGYLEEDYLDMGKGKKFELDKFFTRITSRTLGEQISFFSRKLLFNFDDGTFAWGGEGYFYMEVPERDDPTSNFLINIFYNGGENYKFFAQFEQIIWIFTLFGCVFVFKKAPSANETVLEVALLALILFVMIFESRARYIFCYAPLFITCAMLGYCHLRDLIRSHKGQYLFKKTSSDTMKA